MTMTRQQHPHDKRLDIIHSVTDHNFQSFADDIGLNHIIRRCPSDSRTQRTAVEKMADSSANRSPAVRKYSARALSKMALFSSG